VGWVTRWLSVREVRASAKSIAQRSRRSQRGIGEGNLAIGKLCPESALFSPDHDLHAAIELLLVH
jgi:hypothetical protein